MEWCFGKKLEVEGSQQPGNRLSKPPHFGKWSHCGTSCLPCSDAEDPLLQGAGR
eukprot:CAMPEP_0202339794 /NCGR_PEP_ID=MMETSP1126-20121109/1503_1 /ASSEMBLY_ACC=CAM_ASM_000457 /TAXON_ID=3047 /ORGANISM="Dunaliella tertiolecta, Strain CCMP1320" /LENGTH=53 /DNA_ID=CAMNT_0048930395 /DNA_START=721 /DNA_END=882 /DNA_ORIENTATION=-